MLIVDGLVFIAADTVSDPGGIYLDVRTPAATGSAAALNALVRPAYYRDGGGAISAGFLLEYKHRNW